MLHQSSLGITTRNVSWNLLLQNVFVQIKYINSHYYIKLPLQFSVNIFMLRSKDPNSRSTMISSEFLSKDILNENFIRIFNPLFRFQWLLGSCRVDARDRFVTPPTIYQKMYTILIIAFTIVLVILALKTTREYDDKHMVLYYLSLLTIIINEAFYILNVIHIRFFNNDSNRRLYIKMQELDRVMNIENNKVLNAMLHSAHWVTITILFVIFSIIFTFVQYLGPFLFMGAGVVVHILTLALEISFCSNIILYFLIRIRFINSIIANHIKNGYLKRNMKNRMKFLTKAFMRQLAAQSHDFITSDTDIYLKKLFACFNYFQDLFKLQVSAIIWRIPIFFTTFYLSAGVLVVSCKQTICIWTANLLQNYSLNVVGLPNKIPFGLLRIQNTQKFELEHLHKCLPFPYCFWKQLGFFKMYFWI